MTEAELSICALAQSDVSARQQDRHHAARQGCSEKFSYFHLSLLFPPQSLSSQASFCALRHLFAEFRNGSVVRCPCCRNRNVCKQHRGQYLFTQTFSLPSHHIPRVVRCSQENGSQPKCPLGKNGTEPWEIFFCAFRSSKLRQSINYF